MGSKAMMWYKHIDSLPTVNLYCSSGEACFFAVVFEARYNGGNSILSQAEAIVQISKEYKNKNENSIK